MSTEDSKLETGILIQTIQKSYGTEYLTATVVTRDDQRRIRNISTPYYYDPKALMLADLQISGHFAEISGQWRLIGFAPQFKVYAVAYESQALAMAKTLKRIGAAISKDSAYDDPGDLFAAVARAIGATFAAFYTVNRGSSYDDCEFDFMKISEARNRLRRMVDAKLAELGAPKVAA